MPEFQFAIDRKLSSWDRDRYIIEAETYEQALEVMTKVFKDDSPEDYIEPDYVECLDGTIEDLDPEDNGGQATREMFYINDKGQDTPIADNAILPIQNPHV